MYLYKVQNIERSIWNAHDWYNTQPRYGNTPQTTLSHLVGEVRVRASATPVVQHSHVHFLSLYRWVSDAGACRQSYEAELSSNACRPLCFSTVCATSSLSHMSICNIGHADLHSNKNAQRTFTNVCVHLQGRKTVFTVQRRSCTGICVWMKRKQIVRAIRYKLLMLLTLEFVSLFQIGVIFFLFEPRVERI